MGRFGRVLTSKRIKCELLLEQEGRCAYCNSSLLEVEINWDHLIPWSYLQSSGGKGNRVASCDPCNAAKSNKIFRKESDIADFSFQMVKKHGSLGEGWPEGAESWKLQLQSDLESQKPSFWDLNPSVLDGYSEDE